MNETPIDRAIKLLGGQAALARALRKRGGKASAQLVYQWKSGRRPISASQCIPIEKATRARVTRHELRPDVFGPPPNKEVA